MLRQGPRRAARLAIFVGASFAAACVSSADVHTYLNPEARFGEYATFSVAAPEGAPRGFEVSPRTLEAERKAKPLVETALAMKGYREVPSGGDVLVAVGAGRRDAPERATSSVTNAWLPDDESQDAVEGALVIDAYDAKTGALVWHGAGLGERSPGTLDERQLEHTVADVLWPFPAAAARAAR